MKKIFLFPALLSILLVSSCSNGGKKYSIRPNLKAGSSYGLQYKIEMDQDAGGSNNKVIMSMGSVMKIKNITEQRDIEMDFMYDHMAMSMNSGRFAINYDSDSASAPAQDLQEQKMKEAFDNSLGRMIKKPMQVTVDSSGKVKEVKGYRELLQSIADSGSGRSQNLGGLMSDKQIDQLFQQTFSTFPTKPVSIGEEWTNEFNMDQNGIPLKFKNTYKLIEILEKENEAIIDLKGTISMAMHQDKSNVKMEGSGTQTGKLTIDMNTGLVKTGKQILDIKMNLEAGDNKMPMTMKGVISLTGKKL